MIKKNVLALVTCMALWGCSTDVDVTAPYQELPIVYFLIDADDSTHHARITKGYLPEGQDARPLAADSSLHEYAPGELTVTLTEIGPRQTIPHNGFVKGIVDNKKPGMFYYPYQGVFSAEIPNLKAESNFSYTLQIQNPQSGLNITSEPIGLVGDFTIFSPSQGSLLPFHTGFSIVWGQQVNARIVPPLHAASFEISAQVYYTEYFENNLTITKQFNWPIAPNLPLQNNNSVQRYNIEENILFDYLLAEVDTTNDTPLTERSLDRVEFKIVAVSQAIQNYINVNNNVSAITQVKPVFSNIEGALGVFGSVRTRNQTTFVSGLSKTYLSQNYPSLKFRGL